MEKCYATFVVSQCLCGHFQKWELVHPPEHEQVHAQVQISHIHPHQYNLLLSFTLPETPFSQPFHGWLMNSSKSQLKHHPLNNDYPTTITSKVYSTV